MLAKNKVLCSRKLLFLRWKLSQPVNKIAQSPRNLAGKGLRLYETTTTDVPSSLVYLRWNVERI